MPYPNEHAARINSPKKYKKFNRVNDKFGSGIDVIFGITDKNKSEIQAIRFDKKKFDVKEAKKWLKDHDKSFIKFEKAVNESRFDLLYSKILTEALTAQIDYGSFSLNYSKINADELDDVLEFITNESQFKMLSKSELIDYLKEHTDMSKSYKMVDKDGKIVGAILSGESDLLENYEDYKDTKNLEIFVMLVDEAYRGKGLGHKLVELVEKNNPNYDNYIAQVFETLQSHKFWKNQGYVFHHESIEGEVEPVSIYVKKNS